MDAPESTRPMTAEQIRVGIEDLAQNGEGADRRWALKTLKAESGGDAELPPPLNDDEIITRMARMMRGCGKPLARRAYIRAFPRTESVEKTVALTSAEDLGLNIDKLPRTLKQLYRLYPEIKGPGFPKGYPVGKGPLAQQDWCRKTAIQIEVQKREAKTAASLIELEDRDVGTDSAAGHHQAPAGPPTET